MRCFFNIIGFMNPEIFKEKENRVREKKIVNYLGNSFNYKV